MGSEERLQPRKSAIRAGLRWRRCCPIGTAVSIVVLLLASGIFGCAPRSVLSHAHRENGGRILLYLQPVSQEAEKLRFLIDGISAVQEDGTEFPLTPSIVEFRGADRRWVQNLLASEVTPPGAYKGISIRIKKASLLLEEGEASLLVPDEAVFVPRGYHVGQGKALALFLAFDPSKSIRGEIGFEPVFSFITFGKELANLIGFATSSESDIVTIFNKRTMEVTSVLGTGANPRGMVLDQRAGRGYVAVSGGNAVEVIDVSREEIIARIALNLLDDPVELALSPDGKILVTANYGSNTAGIINARSMDLAGTIRVGEGPTSVVIDPNGVRAYVLNSLSSSVSVIDLPRNELLATMGLEGAPLRGAFNRRGNKLYVVLSDSPFLTVIDPSRLTVIERIYVGIGAVSIKVDTQSDLVYIGKRSGGISIIDPISRMIIDRIDVVGGAFSMTIDSEENALFVLQSDRKTLQKINLISKKVMRDFEVANGAYSVSVMGER